jgi:hypothetical protein
VKVRSTRSSLCGRFSRPFFKLSVTFWRSSSWAAACNALLSVSLVVLSLSRNCNGVDVRCSIGVEQDVPIAQLLRVRTVLQVLLQTVLPDVRGLADGADGRLVDDGVAGLVCHGCFLCSCSSILVSCEAGSGLID